MKNFNSLIRVSNNNAVGYGNDTATTWQRHGNETQWKRLCLTILTLLLTLGVGQMWAATIFNCGIDVNDTWYKGTGTINSGNWLGSKTAFNGANLGALTSMTLGGQYDTWDNNQTDYCSWNSNNGIHILIKKGSTQVASFKLTCYHDSRDGNNNVWKTKGGTGSCSDSGSWGTYTVDISGYAAGNDYTIKATWTSPSSQSNNATASFTINPVVTFKANGGTGSDYTQRVTYNTNTALTANTFTRTGYTFAGWATSADGNVVYAGGANVKLTAHTTLYAKWTAKTTTITLDNQEATTAGSTSVTATYDAAMPAITLPTKTGYTFGGYWGAPHGSGPKLYNADGSSNATWQNEESTYTLYAAWAENKSTVTLVASPSGKGTFQVGGETLTSTQAGVATTPAVTAVPIAGYSFSGWSITGGATISSTTDNPTTVTGGGAGTAATLTATFEEDLTYFRLKFGTRSGETSNGSVAAKDGSNNPLTSNTEYLSGTSVTVTATAADDYKFDSWYHGWSTGDSFSSENPLTFTLTGATNVYAHFVQKTTSITLNKNGGSGGTTGPVTATHGSTTLSTNPLVCPAKSGYTFTGYWTESSGGVKVIDTDGTLVASVDGYTKSGNKKWDYDDPTLTLYAQYAEKTVTLTPTVNSVGTAASYTVTGGGTVGISTTRTLTASTPGTGYTFTGWTLSSNLTITSGTTTSTTITVKTNGDGEAVSAEAVYAEDLSSPWTLKGGSNLTGNNWAIAYNLTKKTGHSAESVAYYTLSISSTNSGQSGEASTWSFKLIKDGSTWYGLEANAGTSYWWQRNTAANQSLITTNGRNIQICADVAGDYEIKVDYSTSTPKVTVTFPTSYTVTYGVSPSGAANAVTTSPSFSSGAQVLSGTSVTFTHQAAKTGYTWKGWYNNTAGTGNALGTGNTYTTTISAATQVYAVYTENSYNVTVSAGANGSVSPSGTVAIKQISGTELTATPNTGFYLTEWTKEGTDITLSSTTDNTITAKALSGGGSITANFASQWAWASDKNSWSTSANVLGNYSTAGGKTSGYVDVTLAANTQYSFKFVDVKNNKWYGPSSNTEITYANRATAQTMSTVGGVDNQTIMTGAPGSYRFTWNITDKKVTVTYPTGYTVTFSANTLSGTGDGASSAPTATYNSGATSVTSGDYVPASTSVTFTAYAAKSGYTFNGWYDAASGGTRKSSDLSYSEMVSADITRYARYTQNTHTVTLTNDNTSQGTVNTSSPVTVGEAEAVQIQATPKTDYMFRGWVKTAGDGTVTYYTGAGAGQVEDASGNTKATTYITVTGNVTLKATWDDDRWSGYYVHYGNDGKNADGGNDESQRRAWADGNLYKKADEMAGTVSYFTYTASASDVGKVIEFKIVKYSPDTWYGYNAAGGGKITGSITNAVLNTSYGNGRMVMPTPGDYVFKWDSNGNKLSITYPAGNYIRGDFNSWGWDHALTPTGNANEYSATISLTGANAEHLWSPADHGFKVVIGGVHYGKNSTIIAPAANSAAGCATNGSNIGLATTIGGNYVFTYNTSTNTVTVTYPNVTAMTGTVGLTMTGYRSGSGTELNPYSVYEGDEITISKTHTSAPANDSHFKYTYYTGAKNASTATTELATRLSTADNTSYTFTVNQEVGKYPLKVAAYYEYGPEGYKVKGTAQESGIVYFRVHLAPGVELTADKTSITDGQTVTLTATPDHLEVHGINVKYEFFRGNSTADVDKISETTKTVTADNAPTATQVVTPDCSGDANNWTYTVRMTYLGITKTTTVTVYRKWDIYVNDVCGWGAMKLYNWDGSSAYPVAFPGTEQPLVDGSTHWYKVTLDARYPNFKLSKQSGTESNNHIVDHATYLPGTYWYLKNCNTLEEVSISTPTVTISATVTEATKINLTGNITNFGGDDTKASKMKEVYFNVNGSKDATGVTASDSHTFTKTLDNPTASASPANTLQAAATNIAYTGSSSTLNFTNVTLDMQSGASGTAAVLAVNGVAMASGATAPTRTGYTFGGYYAAANGSGTQYYNADMTSATNWDQTTATKILYAKWTANTYSVHFDGNGATSGEMADETGFTYDVSKALTANAFERTGYTFQGWATAHDGAKVYNDGQSVSNLSSTNGATVTLYAVWQAKTYLVTLDKQIGATGYRSSGAWTNPTVTYDATPTTMSGTAPGAADGYGFMGFYTETDGGGLQLIDKTGAWQASKEGYTDASAHWIHDGAVTVYAYYKQAEIITLNFVASIVQPSSTVQVTPVVEPAPEGDTHIEWRILYDNNNPLDPQPAKTTYNTTGIQFTSSASSGSYKVEATLKTGLVEGAGTELSTKAVAFQVAGEHTITVKYVSGSYTIQPATEALGLPLDWSSITAPTLTGYTFSRWVAGEGITIENPADPGTPSIATTATIRYKAIYDGVLTAEYTKKRLIYFYNTLGWSDVNVYFYKNNSYWGTAGQGTGANTAYAFTNTPYSEGLHGQMLPIAEGSNIYYFDAEAAGVNASYTTVAFTELAQHGCNYFYNHNKVIRRDDYKSTTLPMFVPLAEQEAVHRNGGAADYYDKGYWMNYPENTGYTLKIYNNAYADKATGVVREFAFPFSDDKKMPLKMDVEFNDNGTHEYWFMVYRNDGTYLGNTYVFNQNYNAEQIITGGNNKSKLITSAPGKYNFMLTYHDNGSGTTNYYIDVDFPIAVGDYRIVYQDNATWSLGEHTASWNHPSDVINKIAGDATEAKKDTVSFFVAKGTGITASMKFQYASAINETTGAITWTDVTGGSITIPTDVVTEAGVYNFIVSQPVGGASIALEKAEPYIGNFYIRTDIAGNTKWDSYKANDHLMQYSDYAAENENFTHYYAHWVERNTNIKFVIANDYSPCISDTLVEDVDDDFSNMVFDDVKKEYTGTLKSQWPEVQDPTFDRYSANIRFMYNEKTNKISRAYVSGSSNIGKFIIMHGASTAPKIYDENGAELAISGLDPNSINLVDDQNFIYETTIMANPTTRIKLTAEYSGVVQRFKGDDKEGDYTEGHAVEILGGTYTSASIKEKMRVIYDFKTNRLVCAWLPSGEIDGDKVIDADVMIIREHQGDAQQISFKNNKDDLSGVKYVYGVMRFNRWDLANKDRNTHEPLAVGASIYERRMYFISFPFDVNLGDIFGLGRYDDHWWIQYYDGADRANKGFFQESTTFWKFMENTKDAKLKANEGYILTLGSEMLRSDNMDIWVNEINQVELFFPSADVVNTIEKTDATVTLEELPCTINHNTVEPGQPGYIPDIDRRKRDSHWHCMGVPSYANYSSYLKDGSGNNITWSTWSSESFPFLYVWNMQDNTLTPTAASTHLFKTMHAYMVQAYGNIEWKATSVIPSSVAARRNADYTGNYMFRLNLMTGGKEAGRTFINLRDDEKVTNNFDFNYDLSNEGGAIYTTTGDFVNVAGNCLPLETEQLTVIPVGVVAKTAGEYTFAMPDGTEGLNVVLFDSQENIHTDLSLTDYTVELPAGTYDNRFYLTIDPRKTTTSIDLVGGEGSEMAPRKVFVNGLMYIIRGNDVYDANGRKLK